MRNCCTNMVKTLINKKYNFTTILLLVIAIFSVSHSASADTYINHTCNDGGLATATVNITPPGPFLMFYQSNFTASGQIQSTCGPRNMNLTAQNNSGPVYNLIPETFINPGIYPQYPVTQNFQSPAGAPNIFAVHFKLGVDEPLADPLMHYGLYANPTWRYNRYDISMPWQTYPQPNYPPGNAGGKFIIKVNGVTICDTSDGIGSSYDVVDCGSMFYTAKDGDTITVTAQAYQNYYGGNYEVRTIVVQNEYGQTIYGYNHADHNPTCSMSPTYYNNQTAGDPNGYCNLQTLTFTAYGGSSYYIYADFIGTGGDM